MTESERLYNKLSSIDNFPMRVKDESISYFFRGRKVTKQIDGTIVCFDITDSNGRYFLQNEGQVAAFFKKHFEK